MNCSTRNHRNYYSETANIDEHRCGSSYSRELRRRRISGYRDRPCHTFRCLSDPSTVPSESRSRCRGPAPTSSKNYDTRVSGRAPAKKSPRPGNLFTFKIANKPSQLRRDAKAGAGFEQTLLQQIIPRVEEIPSEKEKIEDRIPPQIIHLMIKKAMTESRHKKCQTMTTSRV